MSLHFAVSVTASVIHKFSRQHLEAARHFADSAMDVESEPNLTERHRSAHRAYVTGAIIFSVAFLEASINEFYLEAVGLDQTSLQGLTAQQLVSPLTTLAMNSGRAWRTIDASSGSSMSIRWDGRSGGCIRARRPAHGS